MSATRNEGMKPRPFESSRISDQSRFEDAPAPVEDDMISKYIILEKSMTYQWYRGPLLEAPSPVWVSWSRGIPRWQLSPLVARPFWLLEHRNLPRTDFSLGDGLQVVKRILLDIPFHLILLVRKSIYGTFEKQEREVNYRGCILPRITLKRDLQALSHYLKITIFQYYWLSPFFWFLIV